MNRKKEFDALAGVGLLTETPAWPEVTIRCTACNAEWRRNRRDEGRSATIQDRNAAVAHVTAVHAAALESAALLAKFVVDTHDTSNTFGAARWCSECERNHTRENDCQLRAAGTPTDHSPHSPQGEGR